ncbi:MAG: UDP-N-acetylmuramoyl-tripeptide--D-alanyl-D-alanine ligase [Tidjanibacter sp.]|nr:UDP-N-acetylmuramoyl-tripeptide--D-alanyl-D-alanine ligase [Tidjanibacter sp.]
MKLTRLYEIFRQYPQVTTDSRKVTEGSIFFALRGDKFDGNRFAAQAIADGAVMAVVDDVSMCPDGANYFVVDDVLATLQELARMHRRVLGLPVVAVTGTNGKTTTKELLTAVLAKKCRVASTRGNLNNHIGVPLTLLSLTPADEVAVVEMGASACGEIAALCSIAEPDYGIITNIGRAHLDGFGGVEGIRRGKGELYDWLTANGGRAFVNSADEVLMTMVQERTKLEATPYSPLTVEGWKSNLVGEYNLFNIAAAVAVGAHFGVEHELMREAIADYEPTIHRSQVMRSENNVVIADCYNANPSSMEAALRNFAKMPLPEGVTQKVAILGDMLELGAWSRDEHAKAFADARHAVGAGELLLVGSEFSKVAPAEKGTPRTVHTFADRTELEKYIARKPISEALVLVKGSNGVGLEKILSLL